MAQMYDAKLGKKDGHIPHILSIGHKLLYEIHSWSILDCLATLFQTSESTLDFSEDLGQHAEI
jgi:hypothetical protein